jgi:molybdenum cofactor cytidylyltransferase
MKTSEASPRQDRAVGALASKTKQPVTAARLRRRPSALVLAAGASSRFPGTKQLALIGRRTLVERAVDLIPQTQVRETVVVLGHDAEAVGKAIHEMKGVRVVVNPHYRAGIGTSIGAGISALAKDTHGAMLLLADQPFVTLSLLRRMLRVFEAAGSRGRIVAATDGDLVAPPVIFSREYFRELEDLRGDEGARSVIERHPTSLYRVRVGSKAVLRDVDTGEDLEAARRLLEP